MWLGKNCPSPLVEPVAYSSVIGISCEDLPSIFNAFERLESRLKIKAGGTGLGLYLTKKLVTEVLKGTIDVESEEGKGSAFRIIISKDKRK